MRSSALARFQFEFLRFEFPTTRIPVWSDKVDRWYQLDAAAFGLLELVTHKCQSWKKPDLILGASPGGSNDTDRAFVQGSAFRPAKFVHTLPNIRISVVLQLMSWQVPVICLQNDPDTVETALVEATFLAKGKNVWILGVEGSTSFGFVSEAAGPLSISVREGSAIPPFSDKRLLSWLLDPAGLELKTRQLSLVRGQ